MVESLTSLQETQKLYHEGLVLGGPPELRSSRRVCPRVWVACMRRCLLADCELLTEGCFFEGPLHNEICKWRGCLLAGCYDGSRRSCCRPRYYYDSTIGRSIY